MSKSLLSSFSIIMLVVGLLGGLIGGYIITSGIYQANINYLTNQYQSQKIVMDQLYSTILKLQTDNTTKNIQITSLQQTNTNQTNQINSLTSQLNEKQGEISSQNVTIAQLTKTQGDLQTQLVNSQNLLKAHSGYALYSFNGISFELPQDMSVSLKELFSNSATETSGIIEVDNNSNNDSFTLMYWQGSALRS